MSSTTPPSMRDFSDWRSDIPIQFESEKIKLEFPKDTPAHIRQEVQDRCLARYYRSYGLMEHSVGDVASSYAYKDGDKESKEDGPVLDFAKQYSSRYLDLLEAYVNMEHDKRIPMVPVDAGQLKQMGFTTSEILKMRVPCQKFTELSDKVLAYCKGDLVTFEKIMGIITSEKGRDKDPDAQKVPLEAFIREYKAIPEMAMIDKAHFLMHGFGHMSYTEISKQLYFVGIMPDLDAAKDAANPEPRERLLMEIRQRVAVESTKNIYYGSIGSNPLAYLNLVKNGEPSDKEAELRERLFFVYMLNHFANEIIKDDSTERVKYSEKMEYINNWLETHNKGWQLDQAFIDAMKRRGEQYKAPIFRYGAAAQLNYALRRYRTEEEMKAYLEERPPLPTVQSVMGDLRDMNSFYNLRLSERELMSQTGEWTFNVKDRNNAYKRLKFVGGVEMFVLIKDPSAIAASPEAAEYLRQANALQTPVVTGISGTLDQSTTMAGLVGIGVAEDLELRIRQLETIRLAYLAFMVPAHDHSVHEIMSSSQTFGLKYKAGPGYQDTIFPDGGERFLQQLKEAQHKRKVEFPDHYLTPEYVQAEIERVQIEKMMEHASHKKAITFTKRPAAKAEGPKVTPKPKPTGGDKD